MVFLIYVYIILGYPQVFCFESIVHMVYIYCTRTNEYNLKEKFVTDCKYFGMEDGIERILLI